MICTLAQLLDYKANAPSISLFPTYWLTSKPVLHLANDINAGSAALEQIGVGVLFGGCQRISNFNNTSSVFKSINLHIASDLTLDGKVVGTSDNKGLFLDYLPTTSQLASIDNIKLYGELTNSADYTGSLIGKSMSQRVNNSVERIKNYATVTGVGHVGGIVGGIKARLLLAGGAGLPDLKPKCLLNTNTVKGESEVGGIIGANRQCTQIHRSANKGDVIGTTAYSKNIGGLVGLAKANYSGDSGALNACRSFFKDSYNIGKLDVPNGGSNVGGILGFSEDKAVDRSITPFLAPALLNGGNIVNTFSSGNIVNSSSLNFVGGLIGKVDDSLNAVYAGSKVGNTYAANDFWYSPYTSYTLDSVSINNAAFDTTVNSSLDAVGFYVPSSSIPSQICTSSRPIWEPSLSSSHSNKCALDIGTYNSGDTIPARSVVGDVQYTQATGEQIYKTTAELQSGTADGDLDQWDDVNIWRFDGPGNYPKLRWLNP